MSTFDEVRKKIAQMSERVQKVAPNVIAETATEHYKERFATKEWDGTAWKDAKDPPDSGSLMLRTGNLMSTIRPQVVNSSMVIISAGGDKAPYAKIHNEGGTITQIPTAKQRRFLWAMERVGNPMDGDGYEGVGMWGKAAMSKELNIPIPKRQFMGHSPVLNKKILERLKPLFEL